MFKDMMKLLWAWTLILLFSLLACSDDIPSQQEPDEVLPDNSNVVGEELYGVRWKVDDPDDLGSRCFKAKGLTATFGIGSQQGHSDFDAVYPWSDIRRCNVRKEGEHTVVIFEGETGFTLDGSQGDVFVRIPKFYVQKYQYDGYEYRVVSKEGKTPHPAFIENGRELDAVYVSAFEGSMGTDSLMRSVAGAIPTSNITAPRFLETAQARGPQYTLYDMRTVDMLFTLIAVEYGCRNTTVIFGNGIADYKQPLEKEWDRTDTYYSKKNEQHTNRFTCGKPWKDFITKGTNICICRGHQRDILTFARCTDIEVNGDEYTYVFDGEPVDLTTDCFIGSCAQTTNWTETCAAPYRGHSGRADIRENRFNPEERNPMRYRWMENIVGNVWHYLPDVTFVGGQMYVCSDMSRYHFGYWPSEDYEPYGAPFPTSRELGTLDDTRGVNQWVTTLMEDVDSRGIIMGNAYDNTLTSRQAFGAYYYVYEDHGICVNGGGFDHKNRCNLLTTRAWVNILEHWHLYGARLIFKDLPTLL